MRRNIRLLLAYDGTDFHGWQKQPEQRTVQDILEQATRRVVRHQISIIGSGRTDAGVHAAGQVANFLTTCTMPAENLRRAIGSRLPKDISLIDVRDVPLGFSARAAASKLYRYTVWNHAIRPVERHQQRYAYHFWHHLDMGRMQDAAARLVGEHDFAAFATSGHQRETTVRSVFRFEVSRCYQEICFDVEGSGFLYNQVRNMVGTLIEVGRGHWEPSALDAILASGDRSQAGPTAPARGLSLQWVRYDMTRAFPLPPEEKLAAIGQQPVDVSDSAGNVETEQDEAE